jgi:N-glycosylase/DNA lyase
MDINSIKEAYETKKGQIKARLEEFRNFKEEGYFRELIFCLLTPQSNARKCWEAVEQLAKIQEFTEENIRDALKTRTRFHNNKTGYIIKAKKEWNNIKSHLNNPDSIELRNWLAENVKGYGLKEASHFLRNIGKSNNKIAILDRHILKNLKTLKVIKDNKIKNKKDYLEKEQQFIKFAKSINIPIDALDLLFWSNETKEIFK